MIVMGGGPLWFGTVPLAGEEKWGISDPGYEMLEKMGVLEGVGM